MYKVTVYRKHLIQVELDSLEQLDLIRLTFNKLMVWTDPPMFPLAEGFKVGIMVYTTPENLKHMFDMIGILKNENSKLSEQFKPEWVEHLAFNKANRYKSKSKKFIKKKMSRNNYLTLQLIRELGAPELINQISQEKKDYIAAETIRVRNARRLTAQRKREWDEAHPEEVEARKLAKNMKPKGKKASKKPKLKGPQVKKNIKSKMSMQELPS